MRSGPAQGTAGARGLAEPALRGLFDHAGMFPPAALDLPAALRDAAQFPARLARPGLVGADLVLRLEDWRRLREADLDAAGFAPGQPCRLALVGARLADGAAAAHEAALHNQGRPRLPVASLELHAAAADLADPDWVARLRHAAAAAAAAAGATAQRQGIALFLEPKWTPAQWRSGADSLCQSLAKAQAGLKFRCAGPDAVDQAAARAIVLAVARAGIPAKATQGLHHPVPRPGHPLGFLGLLAALRLRQAKGAAFTDDLVARCIGETEAGSFRLDDGIAWKEWRVPATALAALPPFAIGSCSLAEPDADLAAAFGRPGPA